MTSAGCGGDDNVLPVVLPVRDGVTVLRLRTSLHRLDHAGDERERKADDVEVAAVYARHPPAGATLNGVGPGFVERLAGGHILVYLLFGERDKADKCNFRGALALSSPGQTKPGDDLMSLAGEQAQHAGGVDCILRLTEDLFVDKHDSVGA